MFINSKIERTEIPEVHLPKLFDYFRERGCYVSDTHFHFKYDPRDYRDLNILSDLALAGLIEKDL